MNGGITLRRFTVPAFRIYAGAFRGALIRGVLPALAGALLLAGCGGSGGVSTASTSAAAAAASGSATASAGLSAFQTCLKQHGVKVALRRPSSRPTGSFSPRAFPSGSPRPRGSFAGANSAAFKACSKYAPSGFAGRANQAISSSALAAFKSCLASNGVKVTGSTASAIFSELRKSTGKTAAVLKTCEVLIRPAATPSPST